MEDEQYMKYLPFYTSSVFQDLESFLRTQIDLIEDYVKLVLDEYNSSLNSYEIEPGIYSYKEISEALFYILQSEYPQSDSENLIRLDDITKKIN